MRVLTLTASVWVSACTASSPCAVDAGSQDMSGIQVHDGGLSSPSCILVLQLPMGTSPGWCQDYPVPAQHPIGEFLTGGFLGPGGFCVLSGNVDFVAQGLSEPVLQCSINTRNISMWSSSTSQSSATPHGYRVTFDLQWSGVQVVGAFEVQEP